MGLVLGRANELLLSGLIKHSSLKKGAGILLALAALCCGSSHAIDLLPGELAPKPEGYYYQLAYGNFERHGLYSRGHETNSNAQVETEQYHLRLVSAFSVANMPAVAYVQQPWGNVSSSGFGAGNQYTSGTGDTTLLAALWPYSNAETHSHLVVAGYYFYGNGSYDSRKTANVGENRDKIALQLGYQTRIAPSVDWTLAFDSVRFSNNVDYGSSHGTLTQKPLATVQSGLNYLFTETASLGVMLFHSDGGDTTLNQTARNDTTRVNRFLATAGFRIPEIKSLVQVQMGRDLNTQNGTLETRRVMVRFTQRF